MHKIFADNPYYEIFQRLRRIYSAGDKPTRRRIILSQLFQVLLGLLQTFLVGSVIVIILLLKSPAAAQDNRYAAILYNGLGFTSLDTFILTFSCLAVVGFFAASLFNIWLGAYSIRFGKLISQFYLQKMIRSKFSQDYESSLAVSTDEMLHKSINVLPSITSSTVTWASKLFSTVINITVISLVLFKLNFFATVTMASILLFYYVAIYRLAKWKLSAFSKENYRLNQRKIQTLRQGFSGYVEVFLAGKKEEFLSAMQRIFTKQLTIQLKLFLLEKIPITILRMVIIFVLLLVAASMILSGDNSQSLSVVIIFIGAAYRILPLGAQLYTIPTQVRNSSFQWEKVAQDMDEFESVKSLLPQLDERKTLGVFKCMKFEHVYYSYVKDSNPISIIQNLSFSIEPGEVVVLCGRSGAGKTTVARLTSGLVHPDRGEITINGLSLRDDYVRQQWCRSLGYIVQKPFFLDDTIAVNIAFELDHRKINFKKVEDAVEKACISKFVALLPAGLNTSIGDSVVVLSGGQMQRLAIARALYRGAQVLIMDEATNALDSMTAKEVIQSLLRITPKKSCLIISHGIESLGCADKILVIDDGCIIAQGTYKELLESSDLFLSLVRQYSRDATKAVKE